MTPWLYLVAVAATAWLTYVLTRAAEGDYQPLFYEYYSLNVMIMAVAVYLAVATRLRTGRSTKIWRFLSDRVFGVYLVHVVVLDVLKRGSLGFQLDQATFHPGIAIPLLAVVVFVSSLALVLVLERIPFFGRILV